jgi:hypothetical protein
MKPGSYWKLHCGPRRQKSRQGSASQAVALQRERMKAAALQQAEREKAYRAKVQEAELAQLEAKTKRLVAERAEQIGESVGRQIMEAYAKLAAEKATAEMKAHGYTVSVGRLEPTMRSALAQVRKQDRVLIAVSKTRIFPALSATFDDAFEVGFWRGIDAVAEEERKRPLRC